MILKDAPILILDEATSALDSEAEAAIQDTLYGVMQGKTVIAIAHRLSTIAAMDRIVVLEDGHIAEIGSHAELLAQGGLYCPLLGAPVRRVHRHRGGGGMSVLIRLGDLIRPFEPAEGPPPQTLGAFFRWCLSGRLADALGRRGASRRSPGRPRWSRR